ncbi:MAG: hypothetical protein A2Z88_09380 [Omnitrophica WOR_2 bacterium GWA2_47_8]|nr:MAG: hypothetical protein A2Z88_09380 [Omnitrophica WOR_2 bacterium GWA2_47_8]
MPSSQEGDKITITRSAPKKAEVSTPAVNTAVSTPGAAFYTIQILSSKDQPALEKSLAKAKSSGFDSAFIMTHDLGDKGIWYRLYIGKFQTKSEADTYLQNVRSVYPDAFVKASKI